MVLLLNLERIRDALAAGVTWALGSWMFGDEREIPLGQWLLGAAIGVVLYGGLVLTEPP